MKRLSIILTALLSLFIFTAQSRAQQVTGAAKKAFNKKFKNAEHVHWGMEGSKVYEAEFTLNGTKMSANFDRNGRWKETESEISMSALPNKVKHTLTRSYGEAKVHHVFKVEQPKRTRYEVEMSMGEDHEKMEENEEGDEHGEENESREMEEQKSNVREVVFTADGKVVHKKNENDEEDEG